MLKLVFNRQAMINIFLEVEYEGTNYFGFQIQNKKTRGEPTVQEILETALKKLFNHEIRVIYTSRTDRGVHACAQGVNFRIDTAISLSNIKRALNTFLPADIRIKKVSKKPLLFHSCFSARGKIYRYMIYNHKQASVFTRNFSWHIPDALDLEKVKKISKKLVGRKDFSVFAKDAKSYKSGVREIKSISIKKKEKFIYIDIEGDGFLRGMARNIVSFLVRGARGEFNLKEISGVLSGKSVYVNKPAPAGGLYLYKVKYCKI